MSDEARPTEAEEFPCLKERPAEWPDPMASARRGVAGVPVVLGDGEVWFLAHAGMNRDLDELRDTLYDRVVLRGAVPNAEMLQAAWILVRANHDLSDDETAALLAWADPGALAEAVLAAMFGARPERQTYSEWVRGSLHAAGLDPARIPPTALPTVLDILEATGRTVPREKFISSNEAAEDWAGLRKLADVAAAAKAKSQRSPAG